MKKIMMLLIITFIVLSTSFSYGGTQGIRISIDGKAANALDTRLIDGKVYVDAVAYTKSLGGEADWNKGSNTLQVKTNGNDVIIPEVIKSVSPCVVGIIGNWKSNSGTAYDKYSEDIIHGTGLIISSKGDILTNAHVVKEMDRIIVVLSDGNGYEAKLKCIDDESDLATIKINKTGLTAAKFGSDKEILTGKTVIAIGTPISFSLRNSASIGIISGVNRGIDSAYKLIQTDASINPGNSGGPLVDLKGNVIGINSVKFSGSGIEGLGFSIPVNTIKYVLGNFDKYGYVKRPYLGVEFEEDWAAKVGLPSNNGITINVVKDNSPAQKSGFKIDDILLSINNIKVNTIVDYNEVMKNYKPQDKVYIGIKRGGKLLTVNTTLGEA